MLARIVTLVQDTRTSHAVGVILGAVCASGVVMRAILTLLDVNDRLCAQLERSSNAIVAAGKKNRSVSTETSITDDDFLQVKYYDDRVADFFIDTRAACMVYDRPLVRVCENDTVRHTLSEMRAANVTCALVDSVDGTLLGVVEVLDIVRFVLSPRSHDESIVRAVRQCVVAQPTTSMTEVVRHLKHGRRYIAVKGHEENETTIISQGSILRHVFDKVDTEQLTKSVACMLDGNHELVCCHDGFAAKEAFALMAAYSITSLPILDENGRISGVISATNALHATPETIEKNVFDFLSLSRQTERNNRSVHDVVQCTVAATIEDVYRTMTREAVRHVYVVDDSRPIGVVAFGDILRVLHL